MITLEFASTDSGAVIPIHFAKFTTGITTLLRSKIPSIYSGVPGNSVRRGILIISRTFETFIPYIPS